MSQTTRVLKAISRPRGALNNELVHISYRYGARIHELRKEKYHITTERVNRGLFRYRLVEESDDIYERSK